jgi:hypothetical protein
MDADVLYNQFGKADLEWDNKCKDVASTKQAANVAK